MPLSRPARCSLVASSRCGSSGPRTGGGGRCEVVVRVGPVVRKVLLSAVCGDRTAAYRVLRGHEPRRPLFTVNRFQSTKYYHLRLVPRGELFPCTWSRDVTKRTHRARPRGGWSSDETNPRRTYEKLVARGRNEPTAGEWLGGSPRILWSATADLTKLWGERRCRSGAFPSWPSLRDGLFSRRSFFPWRRA